MDYKYIKLEKLSHTKTHYVPITFSFAEALTDLTQKEIKTILYRIKQKRRMKQEKRKRLKLII